MNNFAEYLTTENIYLLTNWSVVPLWLLLIFLPQNGLTKIIVHSIFIPLVFAILYAYLAYKIYLTENFFDGFSLYLGLDDLYAIYSNEMFLAIFWIHFLILSLFVGSWMSRDAIKYNMPKILTGIILIITYFTGPIGLVLYWLVRIFFAKKISFDD